MTESRLVSYSQQLATIRPSGEKRTDATPLLCPFKTSFSVYGAYWIVLGDGMGVVSLGVSAGVAVGVAVELREILSGEPLSL